MSHAFSRAQAHAKIGRFDGVDVTTSIEVCEQRDVDGPYKKAREGTIQEMTGVDDSYDAPENPDIRVDTVNRSPENSARFVLAELERFGWPARP